MRRNGISDLRSHQSRCVFDWIFEQYFWSQFQFCIYLICNLCICTTSDINLVNLTAKRSQQMFAVGCKSHCRQNTRNSNRFLIVTLNRVSQPSFIACFQITNHQTSFVFITCTIHQPFAIFRQDWRKRRSIAGCKTACACSFSIIHPNLILW